MDWCADTEVPGAREAAEAEICSHLARHVLDPVLVELARPVVAGLLATPPGPRIWVSLDWQDQAPRLDLRALPGSLVPLPGTLVAPGLTLAHLEAARLLADLGERPSVSVTLDLARGPEVQLDPVPADPSGLPEGFPSAVGVHNARDVARGWGLDAAAARAGATLAARVAPGHEGPRDLEMAVARFVEAEASLGGDWELVQLAPRRAILGCRRCPFGTAPPPDLCRFTSALAGGLGARLAGSADVGLDERIAVGDHQCRLVLDVHSSGERPTSHHYRWPPAGAPFPPNVSERKVARGFRVTLSLLLPRDRLTVPVARHLTRAALMEVGVVPGDAHEVELALSEASANVVEHSGADDRYEVSVTIGPSTQSCG